MNSLCRICLAMLALTLLIQAVPPSASADSSISIQTVKILGSINPAQEDLLREAIDSAVQDQSDLLVLQLDTPGGLGDTTRNMVKQILNSPVPIAVWVGPDGSRAASAGVFLVAASHIAGMSPHSNIGSAKPVGMGGKDISEDMAEKVINDFLSMARASAQGRGRNVEWYVSAITESANLTGTEALLEGVVEYLAVDIYDFIEQIGARGLDGPHGKQFFSLEDVSIEEFQPGAWYALLSWLLDPQIAYFLLMGGIAGLFFELTNPGSIFPGVLGGLCLLLSLYALSILPTNAAGLLLILFGLTLFLLEIMITSFGLLSIAGAIAVFFGSVILFRFEYEIGGVPMTSIFVTTIGISLFAIACVYLIAKAHRRTPVQGPHALVGQKALVRQWKSTTGLVHVQGENWSAQSNSPLLLKPGDAVSIESVDGLVLTISNSPHAPEVL